MIKYVGCSGNFYNYNDDDDHVTYIYKKKTHIGYPLPVLLKIAEHQHSKGKPLDVILSYCHYTLQNSKLAEYVPKFRAAGVRYIANASPLGMALFRDAGPPDWHPAHADLREAAKACAQAAKENGLNIAELASIYSFSGREPSNLDCTYIGCENADDVKRALDTLERVKARKQGTETPSEQEVQVLEKIRSLLAPYQNYSWQSPTPKELAA